MFYSPAEQGIRSSSWVSSLGKETIAPPQSGVLSSGTLVTDQAFIRRFFLPTPTIIRRFWWSNGATAATNTVQVGIYYDNLTSLLLGTATVASGTSALQFDNVTDTNISAGRYWMALVVNGTTTTLMRGSNLGYHGAAAYIMAAARPLPATLVPAAVAASSGTNIPLFGFTSVA
jgi:hypothetical protein